MRATTEHLYPIVVLLALAGATLWLERSTREPDQAVQALNPDAPDFVAEGAQIVSFDAAGKKHYALLAERIAHYPVTDTTRLEQPSLSLNEGKQHIQVTAESGEARRQGDEIFLRGNVRVSRQLEHESEPLTLAAETLTIWPETQRAQSDQPVVITQGATAAKGNTFRADSLFGLLELEGAVRLNLPPRAQRSP